MSWDPFIKLTGDTGPTGSAGTFQFNGTTNSILFFDGNQVTGTTEFTYIPGPSGSVSLQGDFLPTQDAVYNLGSTGLRWGEIHVGHGTINIAGPSGSSAVGTIGTDANSIVYTKNGFASPFINIGPSIDPLDPGAIGGWVVGPTGTFGQDDYDLIVQQKLEGQAFPAGVTGPTYSLIKRFGSTGATGSNGIQGVTGPTGPTGGNSRTTGSWTLSAGANTVSFTLPGPGTYSLWVNGNIPNGIIAYTATVVLTNNNVPVVGTSYAWYYLAGNALVFTSIPNQIVGTPNTIITTLAGGATSNVFTFGITNNSGSSKVVNYGYTIL